MVPKGWSLRCLGDITDTVMGFAFKSEDFVPEGVQLIRMGNLYQNQLQLDRNPVYLPIEFIDKYKKFTLMPNELIMSMTGTMGKRDYGFTVQIPPELPVTMLNQRVMKFIPKHQTNIQYLLHLLRSDLILARLYAFPGGTKQANLSAQQVQELSAPVPPLEEQRKIAQILSTWDKAITTTERLLTNRQQQKKALMQRLLTGKQRFAGFEGEWRTCVLNSNAQILVSPVDKKSAPEEHAVQLCNYTDVYYNTRILANHPFMVATATGREIERFIVRKGDVLITKDSETPGDIAKAAYMAEELNNVVCGYHLAIIRADNEQIDGEFLSYLFQLTHIRYYFFTLATGATRFGLSVGAIENAEFYVPNIIEQRYIAGFFRSVDMELTQISNSIDNLKQQKKALMQQLLTGKRRVKVDSPALATQ